MKGFTLLEVLVAVVLFTVISLALYNTFALSDKAIKSVDGYVESLGEGREAIDALRKEIESSFFLANKDLGRFKVMDRDSAGRQTSAILLTTFASGGPGYAVVEYYVDEAGKEDLGDDEYAKGDGGSAIKGGLSGFAPAPVDSGKPLSLYKMVRPNPLKRETVITEAVENVKAFSIEASDGNKEVKTWDTALTGKMPVAVKITLTLALKNGDMPFTVTAYPKIVMDR